MSARDNNLLNKAIALALTSQCNPRTRHGAIIVKGGRVLGRGVNKDRNNPEFIACKAEDYGVHAEVAAIRSARGSNLKGATLYVARVGAAGDPRMSKPCSACQGALRQAGVQKVVYTIESQMTL